MNRLPPVRVAHPHVEVSSFAQGSPYVLGTRVPVRRLYAWHRKGIAVETLVKRYPSIGWSRVCDALSFAYDNVTLIEADLARERALLGSDQWTDLRQLSFRWMQRKSVPAWTFSDTDEATNEDEPW